MAGKKGTGYATRHIALASKVPERTGMEYPKRVMRMSALEKMGIPKENLLCAYRQKGQTFAWKINPTKSNSPIVFDTVGFEKWRVQQCKLRERSAV